MLIERRAARALLIADRSVLLIRGHDPHRPEAGSWWMTPGGGIEDGETVWSAAAREVLEETSLRLAPGDFGPVVATRVAEFSFAGRQYHQTESFVAAETEWFAPGTDGWDDMERRALLHHRWWRVEDLASSTETVYPRELARVVRGVLERSLRGPIRLEPEGPTGA